jgi:hypothetical protein
MTPEQIDECMDLFDRVNPEPNAIGCSTEWEDWDIKREKFSGRILEGPGIALGAVVDYCLPEGWDYSVDSRTHVVSVLDRHGNKVEVIGASESPRALMMVRAISAAIGGEG